MQNGEQSKIIPFQSTSKTIRETMGEAKFFESYSRWSEEKAGYETWNEAVDRVMDMHREKYHDVMTDDLEDAIEYATSFYKQKRILGAQRALQFGGEQIFKHEMKIYNCVSGYMDRAEAFGELAYLLLCGAGVGFSVQKHHVAKLPQVQRRKKQAKIFVIPDSIEGWAKAIDVLLSSYLVGGGKYPEYEGRRVFFDTTEVRPRGALISGGFKAPGPEPLENGLSLIEKLINKLLEEQETATLRPIHVYDICMYIADFVISGGVRRSATIALFSHDDDEMVNAKTGNWFETHPQRKRSNNSAMILKNGHERKDFLKIFDSTRQFGEPGFIFTDSLEITYNPCVEISKYPVSEDGESGWEGCNLVEINGMKSKTRQEFFENCRAAAIIGTLQAGYTNFRFVSEATRKIFEREALLGVSITGFMNSPDILFDPETLEEGARIVVETNKEIAKLIGINQAARNTCVKPSGNASVLLGTGSGIHEEHAPRYLRNMEMNFDQEVMQLIKDANPYMVEAKKNHEDTTGVISFAIEPPQESIFKKDLNGIKFLDKVALVQKHWVDPGTVKELCVHPDTRHNVSNTVTVRNSEWDDVANYLWENRENFAGISLLGEFGDKDFYQAPFTEVKYPEQIVEEYGDAALFASGLIVDSYKGFNDLWEACNVVLYSEIQSGEQGDLRSDWIRRFVKFAESYFDGDYRKASYCLKDVYLLHKWNKITKNMTDIQFENLSERKYTEIGSYAAIACSGTQGCEI